MRVGRLAPFAIVVATVGVAHAGNRLVLVAPPASLARATHAQLAPWQIEVTLASDAPPSGVDGARAIAAHYQARAVAWLDGDHLFVFDRDRGVISIRDAGAPLDDVAAAALALSLKTVLRDTWDIPDLPPEPHVWRFAVIPGARLRDTDVEPRVSLTVDVQPPSWPIALGLRAAGGNGVAVRDPRFSGRWTDRSLGVAATVPQTIGAIALAAGAGLSLHATEIHGVLLASATDGHATADNLGLDGEATASWTHPPIELGVRLAATWVPWRQTYSVGGTEVYAVSHVETELGLVIAFTF